MSLQPARTTKRNQKSRSGRNLLGLVIGINDYSQLTLEGGIYFPKLSGCVADAEKVKGHVEKYSSFKTNVKILKNKEASKKEIVRQFEDHLGKAGKDDTVFIYFSGHGTQEHADPLLFKSESDGRLEAIVCYYDSKIKDFLLADKEMRWLIHRLAAKGPHIVAIFDCCHSADNTRNAILCKGTQVVEKRIAYAFPQRQWNQFIFHDSISEEQLKREGEAIALPEGRHIQMSACESDESAVELDGEALFTKVLLKILDDADGEINYKNLHNRVRHYMRNAFEQKPRLYISKDREDQLYRCFLNNPQDFKQGNLGELSFNDADGWQLNLGAFDGVKKINLPIPVIDNAHAETTIKVIIDRVMTDYTLVSIAEGALDESRVYPVDVSDHTTKVIQLALDSGNDISENQEALIQSLFRKGQRFLQFVDEDNAQYVLRCLNGKYFITRPNNPLRPLIEPITQETPNWADLVLVYLNHIAQWEFLKTLNNAEDDALDIDSALEVKVLNLRAEPSKLKPTALESVAEMDVPLEKSGDGYSSALSITLRNTTSGNLYCAVLLLNAEFVSFPGFLNPQVMMLAAHKETSLNLDGNDQLKFTLYDQISWYNWNVLSDYLKFIVSTEPFEINGATLSGLPSPVCDEEMRKGGMETIKSLKRLKGWNARTLQLNYHNPEPNSINEGHLRVMLSNDLMADFALALYFDAKVDENLQVVYHKKENINIIKGEPGGVQKNILGDTAMDLANWYARRRRNKWFEQSVKNFPTRIKIVSEGDSWFQHPLVLDVIDHVSKLYSVYCVAAAGDTLKNYLSQEKKNGEYFLDALQKHQPQVFLISGGGNDILGSQFRGFLQDEFTTTEPEGTLPERFLRKSIYDEIDGLMKIYNTMFKVLHSSMPKLITMVHGYDYPVKLNDAKKGWLGRYMIAKGIVREGDRKAVMHHIMDYFNTKLKSVVDQNKNVFYLDVRNIVRYDVKNGVDQWYDEIHPNNDGFQQVALKFINQINKVSEPKINKMAK